MKRPLLSITTISKTLHTHRIKFDNSQAFKLLWKEKTEKKKEKKRREFKIIVDKVNTVTKLLLKHSEAILI